MSGELIFWNLALIGATLTALFFLYGMIRSTDFSKTRGTIESIKVSKIRIDSDTSLYDYKINVVYNYNVRGKEYVGTKMMPGMIPDIISDGNEAEKLKTKFPQGSSVEVYYDPENPNNSSLFGGAVMRKLGFIGLGMLSLVVPIMFWIINNEDKIDKFMNEITK